MELKSLNNPVLSSDLKIRMRGWKTFLGIIVYLGIMVLIAFLYYITFIENTASYNMSINARQDMGVSIYTMLAALQFALIILITPAQTAGTISGEREKQTLDLLLCTSLSPLGIILGKLMSSMSYILLLIFSSIPLFSMVFLFGGVTPGDIVMLFLFYIITAISIGSIGIYFSTVFKRTVTA
ncbi:MAG TPA: ABC transporter permease, partial [Bacillota bacterium]|nr:ABC transporter permease [Bacillota bacterium]